MDRISALRNVEEALGAFERDDLSLPELERAVRGILRTYATEFDPDREAYRAVGAPAANGVMVVAASRAAARERIDELLDDGGRFEVERVDR